MKKVSKKKNKKAKNDKWKGFDDCVICQAMKDGSTNSLEGLRDAFRKAEEGGAYVNNSFPLGFKMAMKSADKNDLYYDAMDLLNEGLDGAKETEKLLKRALKMDENYVQTHIGLVHVYGVLNDKKKACEHIEKAYKETIKKFSKWPKCMEWGNTDNRAYLRAIQYRADLFADEGNKEKAIELYRLLLKLNPNDNQGVRFTLAGLYAGISGRQINEMNDEGNQMQNWDELENLVREQNTKHKFWKEPKY